MPYTCPVCGYPNLQEEPRGGEEIGGSYEICPSRGIQFGYDDEAGGDYTRRLQLYKTWRQKWIDKGIPWHFAGVARPADWNPSEQL
jgi:hypothetical protein